MGGSAQAQQNGGRIIAVRAWRMPNPQATPVRCTPAGRISREQEVEQAALAVAASRTSRPSLGPDHDAELRLVRGGKYGVLLKAAAGADLLVVDAPRQLLAGPMFAHRLIYAASCPVVVMPPHVSGEPPTCSPGSPGGRSGRGHRRRHARVGRAIDRRR